MHGKFLEVTGVKLEYKIYGDPDAGLPTLVLLHEGLGCVGMWKNFPQQLFSATGFPVFVYSRQGYGCSDPKPAPWPVQYMHREALEILPAVLTGAGLNDVILIGHSDGASIALIYAGGITGQKSRALVLMSPHVFNEPLSVSNIEKARVAYEETDLRQRLQRYHKDNVDNAFWGWNGAWLNPDFLNWNIEEYLSTLSVPLLVLQGEEDQYGTQAQLDAIQQQAGAGATVRLIPNCRHSPYIDQPGQVLDEIRQFVILHFQVPASD
jgi:pimeloyl-ACP methyl ester carboxylesterase